MSSKFNEVQSVQPDELYAVMCGAVSQDPTQVQQSTERFKQMLSMFGTFEALYEIASTKTVPLVVRQQSIIQFKNCAFGSWRSRKLLNDEHRQRIKQLCLSFLDEPDDKLAKYNEIVVGKIARQDFPNSWPNLISNLMTAIDTNMVLRFSPGAQAQAQAQEVDPMSTLVLIRSLKLVNAIIKELSAAKLPGGLKVMANLTKQLHLTFYTYYSQLAPLVTATLNPNSVSSQRIADDVLIAHVVYKCLVKMAIWAWNKHTMPQYAELEPWLKELFHSSSLLLPNISELRLNLLLALQSTLPTLHPTSITRLSADRLTKHVLLFGKLFRRLQQLHVQRFVELPGCNDLVLYYWSKVVQVTQVQGGLDLIKDSNDAVFPVRFLVQGMVLFKESLAQWVPVKKSGAPNENSLNQQFVEDAVKLLVTQIIPLNPNDLQSWMSDPEEWVNAEDKENDHWEYELRPCGERVLMTLAHQYPQYVKPLLAATFQHVVSQPTVDLPSVIQKEAVYCAIGRCAHRLVDVIPFDQWLEHTLVRESTETNSNYPIVKRRIAWVIGKWISESCSKANNPKIWEVLVYLLKDRGPGSDPVVRLTAAMALRECVDTIDFDADVFAPFLPTAIAELLKLVAEADNLESKRHVTNSLNVIVERVDTRIVPCIAIVAEPLPQLWQEADDDWLLKSAYLTTVEKLLQSSKENSMSLLSIIVPLVRECFTPGAQSHLDEDGLAVWQAALRNAITLQSVNGAPGLLTLFPVAMSLLSSHFDVLGTIIPIVESYIILDATSVLQQHAVDLFRAYVMALKEAVSSNAKSMLTSLQHLFQLAPTQLWGEPLHTSGLFDALITPLIQDDISVMLLTEHMYVMARIALADPGTFLRLMAATAATQNKSESFIWEELLNQWWNRFDSMSEPRFRKLAAMGIASLVSTGRPEVLDRLGSEIGNLWTDVFAEIRESRTVAAEESELTLCWDQDDPPYSFYEGSEETPEYERRIALYKGDVVRSTELTVYVRAALQAAESAAGNQNFQSKYLAKFDPDLLRSLQKALMG